MEWIFRETKACFADEQKMFEKLIIRYKIRGIKKQTQKYVTHFY